MRAWSSCSSRPSTRRSRSRSRSSRSGPAPPASWTTSRSRTSAASSASSWTTCAASTSRSSTRIVETAKLEDDTGRRARPRRSRPSSRSFTTGDGKPLVERRECRDVQERRREARASTGLTAWEHSFGSTSAGSAPSPPTKKITKAMELIAASRIVKAQRAGGGLHAVRRRADAGGDGGGDQLQRQAPADHREPETADPRRGPAHHERPRPGRRLHLQRASRRRSSSTERLRAEGKEVVHVPRRPQGRRRTTTSATGRSRSRGRASPTARRTATPRPSSADLIEALHHARPPTAAWTSSTSSPPSSCRC